MTTTTKLKRNAHKKTHSYPYKEGSTVDNSSGSLLDQNNLGAHNVKGLEGVN